MSSKTTIRAVFLTALILLSACGSGDDDGRRLGELIVGTWQRGWGEGDVVFEGETELTPENFTYDKYEFHDDGSYNGMVRITDDTICLKYTFEEVDISVSLIIRKL